LLNFLSGYQIIAQRLELSQVLCDLLLVAFFAIVQGWLFIFFFFLQNMVGSNNDFMTDCYKRFLFASACN